jgi:hypothetical protein
VSFLRRFEHGDWTVIVEDDDRVVYAYLLHRNQIVGDVWLYNRVRAPHLPPWRQTDQVMPFLNPVEYVDSREIPGRSPSAESLRVMWPDKPHEDRTAIYLDERPLAWVAPGVKPGWSSLVTRNGPLAHTATAT